jgi:hypothetical protein
MFKNNRKNIDGYYYNHFYDTLTLDSGQTIKIEFQEDWTNNKYYYNIYLVIMDKRKSENNTYLKSTGKDGLKGLIWAKNKIKEFEIFIKEEHNKSTIIYCGWDNNRRRKVYEYGLKDLGYKFGMIFNKKALYKNLI